MNDMNRSPLSPPKIAGRPRPFNTISSPGCVPPGTLTSTSPSKVGTLTLPPSSAVCIGIRASWWIFVPCRRKTFDGATLTRSNRSPFGPLPDTGTSPSPGTRIVMPSSTPTMPNHVSAPGEKRNLVTNQQECQQKCSSSVLQSHPRRIGHIDPLVELLSQPRRMCCMWRPFEIQSQ